MTPAVGHVGFGLDDFGKHGLHDQNTAAGRQHVAAVAQDRDRLLVGPVVQDALHHVEVRAPGDGAEEVPGAHRAARFEPVPLQRRRRLGQALRRVEDDTGQAGMRVEDTCQQGAVTATDVGDPGEPAEIEGVRQHGGGLLNDLAHRRVELAGQLGVLGEVAEEVGAENGVERDLTGADAAVQDAPRRAAPPDR